MPAITAVPMVAIAIVIIAVAVAIALLAWPNLAEWLENHWTWLLGLAVLPALTAIGLAVNNNVPNSPTQALNDWTDWFTSIVALVVAVFGGVEAVPKIGTILQDRSDARKTEAEASKLQGKAEMLLATEAAVRARVPSDVIDKILAEVG